MEVICCFANVSLTQRILNYLLRQLKSHVDLVTVIFLNDLWIVHIKLDLELDDRRNEDCWAFLMENGIPYRPTANLISALSDLDAGLTPTQVMNQYRISIVSHGEPNPAEIVCFRKYFVAGLGYCPQAFV